MRASVDAFEQADLGFPVRLDQLASKPEPLVNRSRIKFSQQVARQTMKELF